MEQKLDVLEYVQFLPEEEGDLGYAKSGSRTLLDKIPILYKWTYFPQASL